MKKAILLLLLSLGASAQSFPDFKPLRYDENYEALRKDTAENWYKTIKYMPLSPSGNSYLSFGGDVRYQYFYARNETWGEEPDDNDGYLLNRLLLHADVHAGKYLRTFLQLQSSNADGRIGPSPVDQNPLELHQGFIDLNLVSTEKNSLIFRVGRQELSYGSQRLVAVREGPNNRQSFDAAKTIAKFGSYAGHFFYGHYVVAESGIFDDSSKRQKTFVGQLFHGQ